MQIVLWAPPSWIPGLTASSSSGHWGTLACFPTCKMTSGPPYPVHQGIAWVAVSSVPIDLCKSLLLIRYNILTLLKMVALKWIKWTGMDWLWLLVMVGTYCCNQSAMIKWLFFFWIKRHIKDHCISFTGLEEFVPWGWIELQQKGC